MMTSDKSTTTTTTTIVKHAIVVVAKMLIAATMVALGLFSFGLYYHMKLWNPALQCPYTVELGSVTHDTFNLWLNVCNKATTERMDIIRPTVSLWEATTNTENPEAATKVVYDFVDILETSESIQSLKSRNSRNSRNNVMMTTMQDHQVEGSLIDDQVVHKSEYTTFIARMTGLRPNTTYLYQVEFASTDLFSLHASEGEQETEEELTGSIKTFPRPSERNDRVDPSGLEKVKFAFSSCLNSWPLITLQAFEKLTSLNPRFMLMLGDMTYLDLMAELRDFFRVPAEQAHRQVLSDKYIHKAARSVPLFTMFDDHEVEDNFVGGLDHPDILEGLTQFERFWGSRNPAPVIPSQYFYTFEYGSTASVFVLETRLNYKQGETVLGTAQKQALLDWLLERAHSSVFKVIASPISWSDDGDGLNFLEERREIVQFVYDHSIKGVLIVSGDMHLGGLYQYYPESAQSSYAAQYERSRQTCSTSTKNSNTSLHDANEPLVSGYFREFWKTDCSVSNQARNTARPPVITEFSASGMRSLPWSYLPWPDPQEQTHERVLFSFGGMHFGEVELDPFSQMAQLKLYRWEAFPYFFSTPRLFWNVQLDMSSTRQTLTCFH